MFRFEGARLIVRSCQAAGMLAPLAGRVHAPPMDRRAVIASGLVMGLIPATGAVALSRQGASPMYGLIGRIRATPGQGPALAAILLEGTADMPGCRSYVVAQEPDDADALWITEVWDSAEAHRASLALPAVQAAIARGRPLIAGFDNRTETRPLGGAGLAPGA